MNQWKLVIKNILDNAFRSWVIFLCAALVSGFIIAATLIVRGSEKSLQLVLERLGADITVVPSGNQTLVESAILMGVPVSIWMPRSVVDEIAAIPGVDVVSPQLFLSTMRGASCCSVSDMFMVAYDPATDFTVRPWLEQELERDLRLGEGVGGTYISFSEGRDDILVYGYQIDLVGNLEATGSGLDQSLFFTYDTALEIARLSPMQAERALVISPDSVSTALVRLEEGVFPYQVAEEIEASIPGVDAITSASLFRDQKARVVSLLRSVTSLSILAWVMSLILIGLITTTATSARHQEIGVLRALGARRGSVIQILLMESALLTAAGAIVGIAFAMVAISLFRNLIVSLLEVPLFIPSPLSLAGLSLEVIVLSLASVFLAAFLPILRISSQEPASTIKEG